MSGTRPRKAAPGQPPARPATPELDKLVALMEESQKLGAFLEWLESQGIHLAVYLHSHGRPTDQLTRASEDPNQLLARYLGVDLDKVERERRALLKHLREAQG